MTDEFTMRLRLQTVAAYRELRRGVRRSGRENVVFAVLMLGVAYFFHTAGAPPLFVLLYAVLGVGELLVGLFKWLVPSAEGILLDGIVLVIFAAYNFGLQYWALQNGRPLDPVIIFLGLFMLMGAIGRFKSYGQLRRLFAERPSAEHIAWFDELIHEIRAADPQADELALDLPTWPHLKAKLLGTTAFFVGARSNAVWVAGPDDFEILREKTDRGTGRRRALLKIGGRPHPEFEITDATWANYQKWRAANPLPQSPPTAVGGLG